MVRRSQRRRQGGKGKQVADKKPTSALRKAIEKTKEMKVKPVEIAAKATPSPKPAVKKAAVVKPKKAKKAAVARKSNRSTAKKVEKKVAPPAKAPAKRAKKSSPQGKLVPIVNEDDEDKKEDDDVVEEDDLSLEEPSSESESEEEVRPRSVPSSPRRGREPALGRELNEKVKKIKKDERFTRMSQHDVVGIVRNIEDRSVPTPPSFIAVIQQAKEGKHRTRIRWELWEENELRRGVAIHGPKWSAILNDSNLRFQDRTQVDLKDKWRNLTKYRPYGDVPWRRYMLVDDNHSPILTNGNNPHIFRNRWPIEAAIKVATKDFIYPPGQDKAEIYLKDIENDARQHKSVAEVHVFQVHREREAVVSDIPKFEGMKRAWVGKAKKLRVERFLTKSVVLEALGAPS